LFIQIQEKCAAAVLLNAKGEPRSGGGGGGEVAKKNEPKPVSRPATAKPAVSHSFSVSLGYYDCFTLVCVVVLMSVCVYNSTKTNFTLEKFPFCLVCNSKTCSKLIIQCVFEIF
jgi:hypothetical protein